MLMSMALPVVGSRTLERPVAPARTAQSRCFDCAYLKGHLGLGWWAVRYCCGTEPCSRADRHSSVQCALTGVHPRRWRMPMSDVVLLMIAIAFVVAPFCRHHHLKRSAESQLDSRPGDLWRLCRRLRSQWWWRLGPALGCRYVARSRKSHSGCADCVVPAARSYSEFRAPAWRSISSLRSRRSPCRWLPLAPSPWGWRSSRRMCLSIRHPCARKSTKGCH